MADLPGLIVTSNAPFVSEVTVCASVSSFSTVMCAPDRTVVAPEYPKSFMVMVAVSAEPVSVAVADEGEAAGGLAEGDLVDEEPLLDDDAAGALEEEQAVSAVSPRTPVTSSAASLFGGVMMLPSGMRGRVGVTRDRV